MKLVYNTPLTNILIQIYFPLLPILNANLCLHFTSDQRAHPIKLAPEHDTATAVWHAQVFNLLV